MDFVHRTIEWFGSEGTFKCHLVQPTAVMLFVGSNTGNRLDYCTLLAPRPLRPGLVYYDRFPWFSLPIFLIKHIAEAGLTNLESNILVANMAQLSHVAFPHINCIE